MRITDQQITNITQYDINSDYEQMAQAQTVLASGRQINQPSDNPIGAAAALQLQGSLAQSNEFSATANETLSWLQTTDQSVNGVLTSLQQVRSLAVQGANGALTQQQQQAIAASVDQLLQQAIQSANGDNVGRYVLAGNQTATAPFTLSGGVGARAFTYNGDSGVMQREISPGQTMQINVPGNTSLPAAFSAMIQLEKDLQNGNTAAVGGADLQAIDQASDGVLVTQATVGASINRIQSVQATLTQTQENMTSQLSQLVDANMAQAATNFSTAQATYQAALMAASKVVQPTLLEFLK